MNEPQITITGNLTADPELRTTSTGKTWASLRIASTPKQRDKAGGWQDGETLYLNARLFDQYAENAARSLTKGTRVIVQGKLTVSSYTDQQGQPRTSLNLLVDEIAPTLRFATAQVTRTNPNNPAQPQVGGNTPQAQPWGAPPSWAPNTQAQTNWEGEQAF